MLTSFCSRAVARRGLNLRRPFQCKTTNNLTQRLFHSHEHPPPTGPFTEVESAILSAGYRHVPEHGFTTKAIGLGAKDAGYRDISPSVLPDGAFGLVRWHLATQREGLKGRVKGKVLGNGALTAQDKVEHVTWERLLANQDIIHRWQEVRSCHHGPAQLCAKIPSRIRPPLRRDPPPLWRRLCRPLLVYQAGEPLYRVRLRRAFHDHRRITRLFGNKGLPPTATRGGEHVRRCCQSGWTVGWIHDGRGRECLEKQRGQDLKAESLQDRHGDWERWRAM
ncbi:hypothetical protein LIA77_11157 [Sarocladium implicatum]|nr:hypothetical protein LIA77_11157 [Sarocladium implicatum]